ncbi:uncharacterized protein LOC115928654 [Strongylocentrotus purpuratus]|uniref:EF-hand domain-containing protein n=1 Tax=Strongylocentrotus purpuratus TaxID=7668 RepID=A0A7M7PKP8_STRPU|nr:uncharacterized protein LOC115928654 [Strongylocentrotus purpuratus]|eukprot:XP_011663525.1 PREDICTED: uncharacterized protein LOC586765 [Strongylocentrotus purpuratus]
MLKVLLLTSVYMVCTISMAWGCVSGAGPSWEISQGGRGSGRGRPGVIGPERPRVPIDILRYFAGNITKELAFASIDLDGNGLVTLDEWVAADGALTELNNLLIRLDTDGDNRISLDELQPFNLPSRSDSEAVPRLLAFQGVPDEEATLGATTPPSRRRRRINRRRKGRRGRLGARATP